MNIRALHLGWHQLTSPEKSMSASRTGIVAHSLFLGMMTALLVVADNGIEHRTRSRKV